MKYWIVPSNSKRFNLYDFLKKHTYVDWKQGRYKFRKGDIVFIYSSLPEAKIRYMMEIIADGIPFEESIKDEEYWFDKDEFQAGIIQNNYCRFKIIKEINDDCLSINNLLKHGLKKAPQSPLSPSSELLSYIQSCFIYRNPDPIELLNDDNIYEGAKKTIVVNQYERNPMARQKCIEANGCRCKVCGMDFEEMYGEIGRGFIHVHHIVPISTVGETYQIDPVNDLIPVCPNCHAMLHRGHNGRVFTIDELKTIIQK